MVICVAECEQLRKQYTKAKDESARANAECAQAECAQAKAECAEAETSEGQILIKLHAVKGSLGTQWTPCCFKNRIQLITISIIYAILQMIFCVFQMTCGACVPSVKRLSASARTYACSLYRWRVSSTRSARDLTGQSTSSTPTAQRPWRISVNSSIRVAAVSQHPF